MEARVGAVAAMSKINFLIDILSNIGYFTKLVSPSWAIKRQKELYIREKIYNYSNYDIVFSPTFSPNNKFLVFLSILTSIFWCFFYCLFNISKGEKIILYHTPWLVLPVFIAKKIKRFKVILEVEEIYSDVKKMNPLVKKLEYYAFNNADYFILSNDLLAAKIINTKPYIVFYGNYHVYEKIIDQYTDGKIHLLYAGIIDYDKRGAFNALEAAKYLNDQYVLHIIGSGNIDELQNEIRKHNSISDCKVFYDGLMTGTDYIKYAQRCHIGLSTQKMEGSYLDTSFPSKIINYLGLGLNVVSGDIKCVRESKINHMVNFYTKDEPEQIAQTIMQMKFIPSDIIRNELSEVQRLFINDIDKLIL